MAVFGETIVVGAGIGGLAVALALRRHDINVHVIEPVSYTHLTLPTTD